MSWFLVKLAMGVIGGAFTAFVIYRANGFRENTAGPRESQARTSQCVLCLGEFEHFADKVTLPCGHRLHSNCKELLFVQEDRSCPFCRKRISA